MKVVAIKVAFFKGRRVRVGEELDIPTGMKGSWFVPTDSKEAQATKAKPAKAEPKALSEMGAENAKKFTDVLA